MRPMTSSVNDIAESSWPTWTPFVHSGISLQKDHSVVTSTKNQFQEFHQRL